MVRFEVHFEVYFRPIFRLKMIFGSRHVHPPVAHGCALVHRLQDRATRYDFSTCSCQIPCGSLVCLACVLTVKRWKWTADEENVKGVLETMRDRRVVAAIKMIGALADARRIEQAGAEVRFEVYLGLLLFEVYLGSISPS